MDITGLTGLLKDALPLMLKGALWTLLLAVASVFFGAIIRHVGGHHAAGRAGAVATGRALCQLHARHALLVQLFVIYFGLPNIGIQFDPISAGILGLSLNVGAYLSETIRGSINGITHGQTNAALSLGAHPGPRHCAM